jgi:uncharacterized membrane protein
MADPQAAGTVAAGLMKGIEWSALGIEVLAVAIIVYGTLHGSIRFLLHVRGGVGDAYDRYKAHLGKGLLLGLEFLVAADVIRTVALEQTLQSVLMLGLLVAIRTFLGWSIIVEIEGRWPWQPPREQSPAAAQTRTADLPGGQGVD